MMTMFESAWSRSSFSHRSTLSNVTAQASAHVVSLNMQLLCVTPHANTLQLTRPGRHSCFRLCLYSAGASGRPFGAILRKQEPDVSLTLQLVRIRSAPHLRRTVMASGNIDDPKTVAAAHLVW